MDLVDEEFYHSQDWIKFQALGPAVIGMGFGVWATYLLFRVSFGGVTFETLLVAISLVIATDTLAFSLIFALDYSARFRQIRAWTTFNKLKKKAPDILVLAALIRMRVSLPANVTLKSVYERDKSVFSQESLVRRALEPLR
jgi:hypothetical protein